MIQPSHRNALPEGYRLHWYRIEKVLGQGGFGITYLAMDTNLEQRVAIKEYLPVEFAMREGDHSIHPVAEDKARFYQWGLERFLLEAKTLAQFNHANIVRVMSFFEANHTGYMVMAYEEGQDLLEYLKVHPEFTEQELLDIFLPLLDGLARVHETGFIHRDIKPANIFIRNDGTPVLLDFGSARQAMAGYTRTLTALVSPGFAPFEQYAAKGEKQGPWSDIYAMAATVYKAATRRALPDAIERSVVMHAEPDPLVPMREAAAGRYSPAFLAAIDKALAFRMEDRPQSVPEWREMLTGDRPTGPAVAYDSAGATVIHSPDTVPRQPKHQPAGMSKNLVWLVLVLIVTGSAVFFYPQYRDYLPTGGQPDAIPVLLDRAQQALQAGRYIEPENDNALEYFQEILVLDPANAMARQGMREVMLGLVRLGRAATGRNQFHQADRLLNKARAIDPDAPDVRLARVQLEERKAEIEKQLQQEMAEQERLRVIEEEKRSLEQRKARVNNLLAGASEDMKAQRWSTPAGKNALEKYLAVLKLDDANPAAREGLDQIAREYISLAGSAIRKNDLDKAKSYLDTAGNRVPANSLTEKTRNALANTAERVNRRKQELLAKQQQEAAARQAEIERLRKAEEDRKRAEEQKRTRYDESIAQARLALADRDKELAMKKFQEALSLVPNDAAATLGIKEAGKLMDKACYVIVGNWTVLGGSMVVRQDGTVDVAGDEGTWSCTDAAAGKFYIKPFRTSGWNAELTENGTCLTSNFPGLCWRRK